MIDYQTVKSVRHENGHIALEVTIGNTPQTWRFYDIRGAFVWEPKPYFLILGEEVHDKFTAFPDRRGVLRLLDEYESETLSLNDFLGRLTDSLFLHSATDIYSDLSNKAHADLFYEFRDKANLSQLSLANAPFRENFRIAVSITQDWISQGLVSIPKNTLLWNQLEILNPGDIENEPEKKFSRVRALSFGVCGFQKYPPLKRFRIGGFKVHSQQGWMN